MLSETNERDEYYRLRTTIKTNNNGGAMWNRRLLLLYDPCVLGPPGPNQILNYADIPTAEVEESENQKEERFDPNHSTNHR